MNAASAALSLDGAAGESVSRRFIDNGDSWITSDPHDAEDAEAQGCKVTPLYASPVAAQAVTEDGVKRAAMHLWGCTHDTRANEHLRDAINAALASDAAKEVPND